MTQTHAAETGRDTPDSGQASDRAHPDRALSDTEMGGDDAGGLAGQGGMRDPGKTSDPDARKPS